MARFDPKTYAKNVLRSAGYITVESIKGVNPTLTSYITETASSAKEMYDFAKDFKRNFKNRIDDSEITKEFGKQKKNILDDIRTGKFYNPDREKTTFDEYMKKEGFSFDDLDFDIDIDDEDDDTSSSGEVKAINSLNISQQKVVAASTDEIIRSGRANAKLNIKTTNRMFGVVNNSLSVINTSILNLHQDLAIPLNTHIINSGNFYKAATSELALQTKYLENINKILTERYTAKKSGFKNNYKTSAWEDIFSGGLPDLKKWGNRAKNNILNSTALGFVGDILNDSELMGQIMGSGALSSPIALLTSMFISSRLQDSKFGKSLYRTEDILKGGFAYTASRISAKVRSRNKYQTKRDKYGNAQIPFLDTILQAFDISPKINNKIDHSKYPRGPIDWDGESKRALTMVLPTQLAKIAYALTGDTEDLKIYDYRLGRWVLPSNVSKSFKNDRKKIISSEISGFSDNIFRQYIDDYNKNIKVGEPEMFYSSRGAKYFKGDYDEIMQAIIMSGIEPASLNTNTYNRIISNLVKRKIISRKNANEVWRILSNNKMQLASAINNGRIANNKFMADTASNSSFSAISNNSGLTKLENSKRNSISNTILAATDNKGHNIYWYLQNFYSSFKAIEHNMAVKSFGDGNINSITYELGGEYKTANDFNVPMAENYINNINSKNKINKIKRNRETKIKLNRYGTQTDIYDYNTKQYRKNSYNKTERRLEEEAAGSIFTKAVDKINTTLADIFLGGEQFKDVVKKHGGILKYIKDIPTMVVDATNNLIEKISDWFKNKIEEFNSSNFGQEYTGSLKDQTIGIGKSIWRHAKKSAGEVVHWFSGETPNWAKSDSMASKGGIVTKSGMISVSEGEMIIPSEKNPFYRGKTNKSSQRAQEAMNYRKWLAQGGNKNKYWGSYSEGGTANPYKDEKFVSEIKRLFDQGFSIDDIKEALKKYTKNKNPDIKRIKDTIDTFNITEEKVSNESSKVIDKIKGFKDKITGSNIGQTVNDKISELFNKIDLALGVQFGQNWKNTKDIGKLAAEQTKKMLPQTLSAGTIGAIVGGAMTGSGLGLLGGFTVGAGAYILKNTESISEKLFGREYEHGKMTGGLLPPFLSNIIKKLVPRLAKSGAIGSLFGAAGLTPGGILGGFVIGAGLDFLLHTKTVKETLMTSLFGHVAVDGKRHGGIVDSLRLRVIEPMGDYVKEGIGNITEYFKNTILSPIKRIFDPLKDWIKGTFTKMWFSIGEFIKDKVGGVFDNIGRAFDDVFEKLTGGLSKVLRFGLDKAGKIIGIPFGITGGLGDALSRYNARVGYSSKSAKERVKLLGENFSEYDTHLAGLEGDNGEVTTEAARYIQNINFFTNTKKGAKKNLDKNRETLIQTAVASMNSGGLRNKKAADEFTKLMRNAVTVDKDGKEHTDYSKVIEKLQDPNFTEMSEDNKVALIKKLTRQQSIIREQEKNLNSFDERQRAFLSRKAYKHLNVIKENGDIDYAKLAKINMRARTDLRRISKTDKDIWKEKTKENEEHNIDLILKRQKKEDPLAAKRTNFLEGLLNTVKKIAQNMGIDIPNKSAKEKAEQVTVTPSTESSTANSNESQRNISKTKRDSNGIQYKTTENGDEIPDRSDSRTNEILDAEERQEERQEGIYNAIVKGGLITGLAGILGFGKNKGEKKKTIFDKLKDFLAPVTNMVGNIVGGIGKALPGVVSTITTIGSSIVSGITTIANTLSNIAPIIGVGGTAISLIDSIRKHGKEGLGAVLEHTWDFADEKEANMLGYDRVHYDKDEWQEDYTVKRTFGKTVKKFALTKAIPNAIVKTPNAIKAIGKGIKAIASIPKSISQNGIVETVINGVKFIFEKAKGLFSKFIGKEAAEAAMAGAEPTGASIAEEVGKKAGTEAFVKNLGLALRVGSIILAMENAWEDAQANIGLLDPPTVGERFLSAIAGGISEFILGILTPDFIIDKILWIGELIGLDVASIQQNRAAAKASMEEYNTTGEGAKTGKTYNTVKEYLKNTKGLYTTQDKIKKTVGSAFGKVTKTVGSGFKRVGNAVVGNAKKIGAWGFRGIKKVGGAFGKAGKTIMGSLTSNIKGIGNTIGETLEPAINTIKNILQKVNDNMPYIKESVSAIGKMSSNITKYFKNPETGIGEMVKEKVNISDKNPFGPAAKAIGTGLKIIQIPSLFVSAVIGKLFRTVVKPLANTIVPAITTSIGAVANNISSTIKGDIIGLWSNSAEVTDNNEGGVEGIAKLIGESVNIGTRMILTPPTLVSFGIRKIFGAIKPIAKGVGTAISAVGDTTSAGIKYMKAGDFKGLATLGTEGVDSNGEERGALGNIIAATTGGLLNIVLAMPTMLFSFKNSIVKLWEDKIKYTPIGTLMSELWTYTDHKKDIAGYNSTIEKAYVKSDSPLGVITNIGTFLMGHFIMRPVVDIARLFDTVFGFFKDKKDWIVDKVNGFKNWLLGDDNQAYGASTTHTNANGTTFGGTTGAQFNTTGTGSGVHVSQKGSNRKFGSSNVDENGCGPATAATVLRAYGRGGNLDDAVSWAEAGGYVAGASGVGTRASYFSDILGANGIRTSYTNSKNSIRGAVGSGNPTILLGQDRSNKSKRNSPFGPNPHYVVARGSDSKGHVLIDDPELGAPAIYNKKILNKAKLGILTGGGSNAIQADDGAVWNYLKSAGLTDAGVAGLMGNLYAESGIESNKVEASSIRPSKVQGHDYQRDHNFTYDSASYTTAVDKGLKQGLAGSESSNLNPTFGTIPEYEFIHMPWKTGTKKSDGTYFGQNGYGLVQWTTFSRKQGLYNLAKSKGVSISDKAMQLEYLLHELQNGSDRWKSVYNTLKSTNSVQEASDAVLGKYEQPDKWQDQTSKRASFGQTYYDKFSKNPPTDTSFGNSTSLDGTTGTTQNISFPTYNLTESQLKGVANIIQHEQSGVQARYAEASLMANLIDMKDNSKATAQNLVAYLTKPIGQNWFADGRNRYNDGANGSVEVESTALAAATDIFNNGKRTLPRYINEHDCFPDLAVINGKSTGLTEGMGFQARVKNTPSWAKDRSIYTPGMSIKNVYGSDWKFSLFPDSRSDPFGYTSEEMRTKHGDAHYEIDASGNVTAPAGYTNSTTSTVGGTSISTTSGSNSNATNLSSILSSAFSTVFSAIGEKLTGKAGSIFKLLTGGLNFSNNIQNNSENSNNLTGSTGQAGFGSVGTSTVAATSGSMVNGFPYYMQSDSQWGSHPYGSHGTLSSSACGPTSMAMVMKSYGENVTPVETADWSAAHNYRVDGGTDWPFFKAIGNTVGLDVKQFDPDVPRVKQDLQNGIPVIGSMKRGNFTKRGHFVVFTGMDSRGNIYVNDPSSSVRTGHSWLPDQSLGQAKQFWEISKNGKGSLGKLTETDPSTAGAAVGGSSGLPLYNFIGSGSFVSGFKDANIKAKIKNKHNTSGGFVRATTRDEDEFNAYQAANYKPKQQQPVKTITNSSSANFHALNSDMSSLYAYQNKKAAASYEADRIAYANQQEALRAAKSWADDEKAQAIQRANIANAAAYEAEMAAIAADPTAGKSKYWYEVEQYNLKNTPDAGRSKAITNSKSLETNSNYSSGRAYSTSSGSYSGTSAPVANTVGGSIDATSLNTILEYLKTIAENSKYEATLPTIVDLISKLAGITATINSNSTTTENQDKVNSINSGISSIIQKLDTISSTL